MRFFLSVQALGVLTLCVAPVHAQYFTCPQIAYFSTGCQPPHEVEQKTAQPTIDPLWSPETMSPTTPPVAVRMLKDPTPENALAFARWHLLRFIAMNRAQEVLEQTMASDDGIKALQSYFYFGPGRGEKP